MSVHHHGAGELCEPCMDKLDEDAEELYEAQFELAVRWWETMPAGEKFDHLIKVTKERMLKEKGVTL